MADRTVIHATLEFRHTQQGLTAIFDCDGASEAIAARIGEAMAAAARAQRNSAGGLRPSSGDVDKDAAKIIERFRNGTVKLPIDLEEARVAALPEPWRTDCARALAQRYGFMGARAPVEGVAAQALCTGQMAIEFGQAIQAVGEVQAGVQGIHDPARLRRALKETADLLGELATLRATLQAQLDGVAAGPRAVPQAGAQA